MARTDRTVQNTGTLVYLAGRNFILNSDSPVLTTGEGARPFVDFALVDSAFVAYEGTIHIATQPVDQVVSVGDTAVFSVVADADGAEITYLWQYSNDNGLTWGEMQNANVWIGKDTPTLSFYVRDVYEGWLWRCKMTSSYETIYSNWVTINITA